jgi:hypothetical protein
MATGDTRKQRERHLLDRFLEISGIPATVTSSREAPDFALTLDAKRIGVEVTEIYYPALTVGRSPQARESIEDRIVATARRIYAQVGGRHVHLSALFGGGVNVTRINRDSTAQAIAKLVATLPLNELSHTAWKNDYEDSNLDALAYLNVLPVPAESMSHWCVARAGWVAPLTSQVIQAAIEEKNRKVSMYRQHFDELWLLLATDTGKPSQMFAFDVPTTNEGLTSLFDRTYLFRIFPGAVDLVHSSDA